MKVSRNSRSLEKSQPSQGKPRYRPCPITGVWVLQDWLHWLSPDCPMTLPKAKR